MTNIDIFMGTIAIFFSVAILVTTLFYEQKGKSSLGSSPQNNKLSESVKKSRRKITLSSVISACIFLMFTALVIQNMIATSIIQ